MIIRPVESYSEIYNKYWKYGFWYEKLAAIYLWIGTTITLLGCFIIFTLSVINIILFFINIIS